MRPQNAHWSRKWDATLAEITTARAWGRPWPVIAADLGTTATALRRRLYRHGEHRLARELAAAEPTRSHHRRAA